MKLRIRANSIRLRLGRSEVSQMLATGIVLESTTFDPARGQRLEYAVVSAAECTAVSAAFENGRVLVSVPHDLVVTWGTTDQVGITGTQVNSDGGTLRILVEKDFECIDAPAEESQDDAFPRPEQGIACASASTPEMVAGEGRR